MDTQNDGLEKATPFKHGNFLVSMLDFWGAVVGFLFFFFEISPMKQKLEPTWDLFKQKLRVILRIATTTSW